MAEPADVGEPDPRRVRIGLAIVTAVMIVAVVLAIVVDSGPARAIFLGVAVVGVFQTWRVSRSIRRSS